MIMKKITLFFIVAAFMSLNVVAQNDIMKTRFGVKGGVNFADMNKDKNGVVENRELITSFNAGVFADVPLSRIVSFQPVLQYSGKGTKYQLVNLDQNNNVAVKLNPQYIDLQANFVFKAPLGDGMHLFIGAGPYGGVGVAGKMKVIGSVLGVNVEQSHSIKYGDDARESDSLEEWRKMKRWDYGFNVIGGAQVDGVVLTLGWEQGLAKLQTGLRGDRADFGKNRAFSISLGYLF